MKKQSSSSTLAELNTEELEHINQRLSSKWMKRWEKLRKEPETSSQQFRRWTISNYHTTRKWEILTKTFLRVKKKEFSKLLMHLIKWWSFRLISIWIINMMQTDLLNLLMQLIKISKLNQFLKNVINLEDLLMPSKSLLNWNFNLLMNWKLSNPLINLLLIQSEQRFKR